jgi:hypothetical protein
MTSVPRAIGKSIHSNDQTAFCELMVRPKGRRRDQRALAVRLKKLQSFVAKYVGGERRLDVVEFIRISRALDADPLKLVAAFLANTTSKSARAKAGPKRDS